MNPVGSDNGGVAYSLGTSVLNALTPEGWLYSLRNMDAPLPVALCLSHLSVFF